MLHSPLSQCHRLFFALRPPIELARQIIAASAWLGCDLQPADRLHITLLVLDDLDEMPPALVARLQTVGDAVSASPFMVTLDRLVAAGNWAALRPGSANVPLRDLYDQIARLARAQGIAERLDHQFTPHLTLSYRATAPHNERVRSVSWTAGELLLIHSHLGQTRYRVVGQWLLNGTNPQLDLF